jgi:deoxyribonuclease-4
VNLNARENEKVDASKERILKAAYISSFFNGEGVVFHPAFYLGDDPSKVYITVKRNLEEIAKRLREEEIKVLLRPETTGKATQFGTLDEILRLSNEVDGVAPCIDFAHLHARTGKINSHQEFIDVLDQIEDKLGKEGLENMHIHISGIEYGNRGEKKHLNLEESDIHYIELIRALKIRKVKGVVICESPNLEEDALLLKNTYEKL